MGSSTSPLLPPYEASSTLALLASRIGKNIDDELFRPDDEAEGAAGATNFVSHFGHFNRRPIADSGKFSSIEQLGHRSVRGFVCWPTEADIPSSVIRAIGDLLVKFKPCACEARNSRIIDKSSSDQYYRD